GDHRGEEGDGKRRPYGHTDRHHPACECEPGDYNGDERGRKGAGNEARIRVDDESRTEFEVDGYQQRQYSELRGTCKDSPAYPPRLQRPRVVSSPPHRHPVILLSARHRHHDTNAYRSKERCAARQAVLAVDARPVV